LAVNLTTVIQLHKIRLKICEQVGKNPYLYSGNPHSYGPKTSAKFHEIANGRKTVSVLKKVANGGKSVSVLRSFQRFKDVKLQHKN
jgi:hypothetical protein